MSAEKYPPLSLWALDGVEKDDGLRGIGTVSHEGQAEGNQKRGDPEAIEEGPLLGG